MHSQTHLSSTRFPRIKKPNVTNLFKPCYRANKDVGIQASEYFDTDFMTYLDNMEREYLIEELSKERISRFRMDESMRKAAAFLNSLIGQIEEYSRNEIKQFRDD